MAKTCARFCKCMEEVRLFSVGGWFVWLVWFGGWFGWLVWWWFGLVWLGGEKKWMEGKENK